MRISVILLAGGTGNRMKSEVPKQYLTLVDKPIVLHSLDLFLEMDAVKEIIIVCNPAYEPLFNCLYHSKIKFALPGNRRQDSLFNGFQLINNSCDLVCIHDAARPLITQSLINRVISMAAQYGAATVGMPLKFTVKEVDSDNLVKNTPDRNRIWEIQTPQVIRPALLKKGFEIANQKELTVTDDVSLVELTGHPVKVIEGSHFNIKITTPEDLKIAESLKQGLNSTVV